MNRRGFLLGGGAALAAITQLPMMAQAQAPIAPIITETHSGLLTNEIYTLSRPMIIRADADLVIDGCTFFANPDFEGDSLVQIQASDCSVTMNHCNFVVTHATFNGPAVTIDTPHSVKFMYTTIS